MKIMQNLLKKRHNLSQASRTFDDIVDNVKILIHKKYNYKKSHKITVDNYKQNTLKIAQNDFLRNLQNYHSIGQIRNKLKEIFGVNKERIKRNQNFHEVEARIPNS